MRRLSFGAALLAAPLILAAPSQAVDLKHKLTDLTEIEMPYGVTTIEDFDRNGRKGMVVVGYRPTGTAGSYNRFTFLIKSDDMAEPTVSAWDIVTTDTRNRSVGVVGVVDSVRDQPHTDEDRVASVRLFKARLDGEPATILIEAWRDLAKAESIPSPTPATIEIYRLTKDVEGYSTFERVEVARSTELYGNIDFALCRELKVPIPRNETEASLPLPAAKGEAGDCPP